MVLDVTDANSCLSRCEFSFWPQGTAEQSGYCFPGFISNSLEDSLVDTHEKKTEEKKHKLTQ